MAFVAFNRIYMLVLFAFRVEIFCNFDYPCFLCRFTL